MGRIAGLFLTFTEVKYQTPMKGRVAHRDVLFAARASQVTAQAATRVAASDVAPQDAIREGYLTKHPLHGHALSKARRRFFRRALAL